MDLSSRESVEGERRSVAMCRPGSLVWTREQALEALAEIARLHGLSSR